MTNAAQETNSALLLGLHLNFDERRVLESNPKMENELQNNQGSMRGTANMNNKEQIKGTAKDDDTEKNGGEIRTATGGFIKSN